MSNNDDDSHTPPNEHHSSPKNTPAPEDSQQSADKLAKPSTALNSPALASVSTALSSSSYFAAVSSTSASQQIDESRRLSSTSISPPREIGFDATTPPIIGDVSEKSNTSRNGRFFSFLSRPLFSDVSKTGGGGGGTDELLMSSTSLAPPAPAPTSHNTSSILGATPTPGDVTMLEENIESSSSSRLSTGFRRFFSNRQSHQQQHHRVMKGGSVVAAKEKVEEFRSALNDMRLKLAVLNQEKEFMETELQQKDRTIATLEGTNSHASQILSRNNYLEKLVASVQNECDDKIEQLTRKTEEMAAKIRSAETSRQMVAKQLESSEKKVEALLKNAEQFIADKDQVNKLQTIISKLQNEILGLNGQLKSMKEELADAHSALQKEKTQSARLLQSQARHVEDLTATSDQAAVLLSRNSELEAILQEFREAHAQEIAKFQDELRAAVREAADKSNDANEMRHELDQRIRRNGELEAELKEMDKRLKSTTNDSTDSEKLKLKIEELERTIKSHEDERANERTASQVALRERDARIANLNEVYKQVETLLNRNSELEEGVKSLSTRLNVMERGHREEIVAMRNELNVRRNQISALEGKLKIETEEVKRAKRQAALAEETAERERKKRQSIKSVDDMMGNVASKFAADTSFSSVMNTEDLNMALRDQAVKYETRIENMRRAHEKALKDMQETLRGRSGDRGRASVVMSPSKSPSNEEALVRQVEDLSQKLAKSFSERDTQMEAHKKKVEETIEGMQKRKQAEIQKLVDMHRVELREMLAKKDDELEREKMKIKGELETERLRFEDARRQMQEDLCAANDARDRLAARLRAAGEAEDERLRIKVAEAVAARERENETRLLELNRRTAKETETRLAELREIMERDMANERKELERRELDLQNRIEELLKQMNEVSNGAKSEFWKSKKVFEERFNAVVKESITDIKKEFVETETENQQIRNQLQLQTAEKDELSKQLLHLNNVVKSLEARCGELKQSLVDAEKSHSNQVASLSLTLAERDKELQASKELKRNFKVVLSRNESIEDRLHQMLTEKLSIERKLANALRETANLKSEKLAVEGSLGYFKRQNEKLKSQLAISSPNVSPIRKSLSPYDQKDLDTLAKELRAALLENDRLKKDLASLRNSNQSAIGAAKNTAIQISENNSYRRELLERNNQLRAAVMDLERERQTLRDQETRNLPEALKNKQAAVEINALKEQMDNRQNRIVELEAAVKSAMEIARTAALINQENQRGHPQSSEVLNKTIEELRREKATLAEEKSNLSKQLERLQESKAAEVRRREEQIKTMRSTNARYQEMLNTNTALETDITNLRQKLKELLRSSKMRFADEGSDLPYFESFESLLTELSHVEETIEQVQTSESHEREQLRSLIQGREKEIAAMEANLRHLREDLAASEKDKTKSLAEKDLQIHELDNKNRGLVRDLGLKDAEISELKSLTDAMSSEVQTLNDSVLRDFSDRLTATELMVVELQAEKEAELDAFRRHLEEAREAQAQLEAEIVSVNDKLGLKESEISELSDEVNRLIKENEYLSASSQENLHEDFNREEWDKLMRSVETLFSNVEISHTNVCQLINRLKDLVNQQKRTLTDLQRNQSLVQNFNEEILGIVTDAETTTSADQALPTKNEKASIRQTIEHLQHLTEAAADQNVKIDENQALMAKYKADAEAKAATLERLQEEAQKREHDLSELRGRLASLQVNDSHTETEKSTCINANVAKMMLQRGGPISDILERVSRMSGELSELRSRFLEMKRRSSSSRPSQVISSPSAVPSSSKGLNAGRNSESGFSSLIGFSSAVVNRSSELSSGLLPSSRSIRHLLFAESTPRIGTSNLSSISTTHTQTHEEFEETSKILKRRLTGEKASSELNKTASSPKKQKSK